jgi:D-alanyl-D-alanine carboxypeptidase
LKRPQTKTTVANERDPGHRVILAIFENDRNQERNQQTIHLLRISFAETGSSLNWDSSIAKQERIRNESANV